MLQIGSLGLWGPNRHGANNTVYILPLVLSQFTGTSSLLYPKRSKGSMTMGARLPTSGSYSPLHGMILRKTGDKGAEVSYPFHQSPLWALRDMLQLQ